MAEPRNLSEAFPDKRLIEAIGVDELAAILLGLARFQSQNGMFLLASIESDLHGYSVGQQSHLPREAKIALAEAWHWLTLNALIMPAPDINGRNGFMVYTRKGAALANDRKGFHAFRAAAAFPRELLHPAVADKVWLALSRGDLAEAVFASFKAVEEAVREAGQFGPTDVGTDLMRKAFDRKTGPLTDFSQPIPEREALAHLFAGAIGSYKNPHSHRTVTIGDPIEAQEMVMLASHLLRIVDSRFIKALS